MKKRKIPVGLSDFAEIRTLGYYYLDKTGLIADLLDDLAKVTLITRPRRFGKTLGMSMLAHFFDLREDSRTLFDGLAVAQDKALCATWMNQWPVVFLTFKNIDGLDFSQAYQQLVYELSLLFERHHDLLACAQISETEKRRFTQLREGTAGKAEVGRAIQLLMRLMHKRYGKPAILLLDEYDVPLAKASAHGYYEEMLNVVQSMMITALKDNDSLRFAVITGCLRIAKESIFTGTNNFVSDSISSAHLNEYFGFTQQEVDQLLTDTDATAYAGEIRRWYDGYHFGDLDIYCPWDVMNYIRDLQRNPKVKPGNYWGNTSDNAIIRSFIDYAGENISAKLETLLSGGHIEVPIEENLTYDYLHASEDNLWSILYLTGYLTKVREADLSEPLAEDLSALTIPNAEIRQIFASTIRKWFRDSVQTWNRKALFDAMWAGDAETLTEELGKLLRRTISYHDYREDFYHAFLAGVFAGAGYSVTSNREHGEGRSDVVVRSPSRGQVAVWEVKYAKTMRGLPDACDAALRQIEARQYARDFEDDYDTILCYGIAFFKKRCLVKKA